MMKEVTIRRMGGSVGATIPKDMAARFHLAEGDRLLAIETAHGILLSPYNPDVEEGLRIAERSARRYRNGLRRLAR